MIKLFTLDNLSAAASDAVYKICLAMDRFGFSEDEAQSFESYDALLTATSFALEDGDDVVLGVAADDFVELKEKLLQKLGLEAFSAPAVAERIAQMRSEDAALDMRAQCSVPKGSVLHLTDDGLFSGYTVAAQNGSLTLMPLDFSRIDPVIKSFTQLLFTPDGARKDNGALTPPQPALETEDVTPSAFLEPVSRMAQALLAGEKTLSLAQGSAAQWVRDLETEVPALQETVRFVDVTPAEDEPVLAGETPSARVMREARLAREDGESDFGAAISEIYTDETIDGVQYYAFAAVADENGPKAKKINTTNEADAPLLLGHCLAVLCETVCQKAGAGSFADLADDDDEKPKKKVSKGVIIFAVLILLAAVLIPLLLLHHFSNQNTTTEPSTADTSSTLPTTTEPTSGSLPADNYLKPAEPGATDVTAGPTTTVAPSTSGTFTFYVFGYGHGVGLSQNGAEYLASLGWTYAQILANYYYGTTLVTGDTYPQTINYAGTDYNTTEYLASALETEMGSAYSREALKAQAVALYTFAKYNGYRLNADANAYGKAASEICRQVVEEVRAAGLYIAYGGKTALTPFHSISAGKTTSYYNVWGGTDLPYLQGGRPSYGDYNVSDFKSTYSISSEDFRTIARDKLNVELTGDPATWITIVSHDQALNNDIGYVSAINIGGKQISGNEFRSKVMEGKIRSHCFALAYTPADQQPTQATQPTQSTQPTQPTQ